MEDNRDQLGGRFVQSDTDVDIKPGLLLVPIRHLLEPEFEQWSEVE